jgi:hypothetical protein
MSSHRDLHVHYHQQDTDYYCGAACAQMVLQTIGAGLLDQDPLYSENHTHSTTEPGWYSGPDGLTWTMNHNRPWSFPGHFKLHAPDNEDAISRKICWTIHRHKVAPIAMVYGSAHWIVVRGYSASAHPKGPHDASYSIHGFEVNNPWPPTPSAYNPALAPPPPHHGRDGCGTGGARGVANEHLSYAVWQSTYMTGVPGGYWGGKFLAVCDPEPAGVAGESASARPKSRYDGKELLARRQAAPLAQAGLKAYGLLERPDWAQALKGAKAGEALLVQRLDQSETYFYLVPYAGRRSTVAYVSVDARFGHYQQSVLLPGGQAAGERLGAQEALRGLIGRRIDLGDGLGRVLVRKESVVQYPHLVWRPCRESLSPYFPFHLFLVDGRPIYRRIDGPVFASLTLDLRGL